MVFSKKVVDNPGLTDLDRSPAAAVIGTWQPAARGRAPIANRMSRR
jgi:hypothetical protein